MLCHVPKYVLKTYRYLKYKIYDNLFECNKEIMIERIGNVAIHPSISTNHFSFKMRLMLLARKDTTATAAESEKFREGIFN